MLGQELWIKLRRIHKRGSGWVAALAVMLCLITGAPAVQAEVLVGVSDWPGWVAWYIAEHQGYFTRYGAKVKLVWFANYTDSMTALANGQLDANSQTWSDTLAQLAKGVAVKAILVNDNSAGNDAVMVRPTLGSIAELKGKTIALEQFSVSHFVLATALARNGMSQADVRLVNLSAPAAAAALIAGRVDAAVVWNPWIRQIEKSGGGRALFTSRQMPGLIPDLLVAQERAISAKRNDLLGMVRAWRDTEAFIRDHHVEATRIMAKVVRLRPQDYEPLLLGTRLFGDTDNRLAFDASQPASLAGVSPRIVGFLADNALLERQPGTAAGLDGSLVAEAYGK
jgi:NitT/TauT family transport system substrate-binding protein